METETKTVKHLLDLVSNIVKKHNEIAEITGENFNIFKTLGISTREVQLHSALLAELLNPYGSHGLKDAFLRLFIQQFIISEADRHEWMYTEKATVVVEKWLGNIDDEGDTGGYMDIFIQMPNGKEIIIENKIHAVDQKGQLRRYHNAYQNAKIVYLTLDGKLASNETTLNDIYPQNKIEPICLSYKDGIKTWVEQCKKECVNYPIIRETLTQYIHLIKHLTRQSMNDNMKKEIAELIAKDPKFIESAKEIVAAWEECQFQIIENLREDINGIAKELGLLAGISPRLGEKDSGFWFYKEGWCYCIYYYFENGFNNLYVGIHHLSNENKCSDGDVEKLKNYLKDFSIDEKTPDTQNFIWDTEFTAWDTSWANIKAEIPDAIQKTTKTILEKLEGFKK